MPGAPTLMYTMWHLVLKHFGTVPWFPSIVHIVHRSTPSTQIDASFKSIRHPRHASWHCSRSPQNDGHGGWAEWETSVSSGQKGFNPTLRVNSRKQSILFCRDWGQGLLNGLCIQKKGISQDGFGTGASGRRFEMSQGSWDLHNGTSLSHPVYSSQLPYRAASKTYCPYFL